MTLEKDVKETKSMLDGMVIKTDLKANRLEKEKKIRQLLEQAKIKDHARDWGTAQDLINQARKLGADDSLFFADSIAKFRQKQYDQAIEAIDMALLLDSQNEQYFLQRGRTKMEMGRYNDAIEDFDLAIKYKLRYWEAYYNKGLCYEKLNDTGQAYDAYHSIWYNGGEYSDTEQRMAMLNRKNKENQDKMAEYIHNNSFEGKLENAFRKIFRRKKK